jgi:hypothetical protein
MAIYASVKYRSLRAGVAHRKLKLSASIQKASAVVVQQNVVASITSRKVAAAISFAKLTTVTNWQNLYLHNVHVNAERTIYVLNDAYAFLDSAVFAVDKGLSDSLGFSSQAVFTVGKQLTDKASFSDFARFHPEKAASDNFSFLEDVTLDASAAKVDSFGFSEDVHTLLTFIRQFNSAVDILESISFEATKTRSDSFGFDDSATTHPNKGLTDSAEFTDAQSFDVSTLSQSGLALFDQVVVTRQPYNFVFSQTGDVVTVTGEPDDSFTFADGINSFSVSKSLQDFFALDDFAQINKDVEGVKSNVFGLTESLEASFGKVIGDELFGFADQASLSPLKSASDSIGLSEALGLHPSRLSTDQTTLSDAATLSSSIVKTDSAPIIDTLESNVGKSIQNQLFSLTDQALFALSKPVTDSIMVQELLTSHASKSATDTTALNDAATLSPRIGKSDSTPIVDSLDVEHVVTGALLNQAMIGNIILNAD